MDGASGGYFYEIYLMQGTALTLCRHFVVNDVLFVIVGLLATVLMAKGVSAVNKKVEKWVLHLAE